MARRTRKVDIGGAIRKHAKDETTYGVAYIDLPGGIQGGIARLVEGKVGEYKTGQNKGDLFVYLAGVVLEPEMATDVRKLFKDGEVQVVSTGEVEVRGQRTSIMLPLCGTAGTTPRDADENISNAMNEIRKLAGEDSTESIGGIKDLESLLEEIKEQGVYFKFSTSSSDPTEQYPEPRVWENWYGAKGLEDYEPEEVDDVVEESEGEEIEEPEEDEGEEDEVSFDELGIAGDAGDGEAQTTLTKMAGEADLDPDEYDTWVELAEVLSGGEEEEEEEEEEDDEEQEEEEEEEEEGDEVETPEVGMVYSYKPPRARSPKECECTVVFAGKETCNLKDLDSGKVYKSVPWDSLEVDD